jgi:hypothetical protein
MTRLLTLTAVAALFATGASAQMSPSFEVNAANCDKPQYATTDECKSFLEEGRSSSMGGTKQPEDTIGSSRSPGNDAGGPTGRSGSGSTSGSGGPGGGAGSGGN